MASCRCIRVEDDVRQMDAKVSKIKELVYRMKREVSDENWEQILSVKKQLSQQVEFTNINLKTEIDQLKNSGETGDAQLSALLDKFNILEEEMKEKVREMGVTQELMMAEVNGKLGGVTEVISTAVDSILRVKQQETTSSADTLPYDELNPSEKEGGAKPLVKEKNKFHQEPLMFPHELMMNCFNLFTQHNRFYESYSWNLYGFKHIWDLKAFELSSKKFQWTKYPVEARAKLQLKEDGCVYVSLCLQSVSTGEPSDLASIPQVFYLLKYTKNHKCFKTSYAFDTAFNRSLSFETCLGEKSGLMACEYDSGNDFIAIEIYVEPPLMTQQVHSYDGTMEWNMENYRRRLQLEKHGLIICQESPYFYTSLCGYRVRVEIYLNGVEGKGVTARISLLTGKFDAQLTKFFAHSTTLSLINRKDPEKSINKTVVEDIKNTAEYTLEICDVEEVENLVENDTLFCKVVIKAH